MKNNSQMFALSGSAALFLGVFAPLVSLPLIGNMNYFQNGEGDGVIILVLAMVSAGFAFWRKFRFIWYTAFGSAAVLIFTFVNFKMKMDAIAADMRNSLAGNPFSGIGEMALASIQLQWGWALLVLGIASLFIAAQLEDPLILKRPAASSVLS